MEREMEFVAFGGEPDHFGMLPPSAVSQWTDIERAISAAWREKAEHDRLRRIAGSLDKLSAALLQVSRLRAHHDKLIDLARHTEVRGNEQVVAERGTEVIADFEGLLFQARAA